MCGDLTGSLPIQLPCFIKHLQAEFKTCAYINKRITHKALVHKTVSQDSYSCQQKSFQDVS